MSAAKNNPVLHVDPDGKIAISALLIKAGAGGSTDLLAQLAFSYSLIQK